ncbi:MAG: glycosyltransferase [Prevotellaceae bacterium]|nr:glycosyltransferase [Prevotellaceae bacterium]
MNNTILISAYACEPYKGSEQGVGWNWALQIAKRNKVIVITRSNNEPVISDYLMEHPMENITFHYCDVPNAIRRFKKGRKGVHWYYYLWQYYCYKKAKEIIKTETVDYTFTVTFGNMWLPTFLYKLPVRHIWGPIGGEAGIPKILWDRISLKQKIIESVRAINPYIPISNPFYNRICKKSYKIIARTNEVEQVLPRSCRDKVVVCLETGASAEDCKMMKAKAEQAEATDDLVHVGQMIPRKMLDIGIEAFARIANKYPHVKYNLVGTGPEKHHLKELANEYGLKDRVIFHGIKPRDEAIALMQKSAIIVHPSAYEGGCWSLFEAMISEKAIVCFDVSGNHVLLTDECAELIPMMSHEKAVGAFAQKLDLLLSDKILRDRLGKAACERILNHFLWDNKGEFFERLIDNE